MKQITLGRRFRKRTEPEKRGEISEKRIQNALRRLKMKRKIRDFTHSSHFDDRRGKDFFIIHCGETEYHIIPLQVKTSRTGQEFHKKAHPDIPSIRVGHRAAYVLERKIVEIVENFERRGKEKEMIHL